MVALADRCRQTSTSKAPPFVLQPPTAEWFALSTLPATTDIALVLVGRTTAGVAVGVVVGRGGLDGNGAVVVDVVERGSLASLAAADVVEVFASATMSALLEMIAAGVNALANTLGDAATLDVGTSAGTVAAGNDSRFTDARPPTMHAATHLDGADALSIFDLWRVSRFGGYLAVGNQNITLNPIGAPAWNESGGAQRNVSAASLFTSLQRRGYVTAATAGSAMGGRSQAIFLRDFGGFRISFAFGVSDPAAVAGARMFVGLRAATTAATDVQIDSVINAIGIGHEAGDAGYSIFCNDAAGVATKVPLDPAKFPTSPLSTDIIRVEFITRQATADVVVNVANVTTGQTQSIVVASDLPAAGVGLTPTVWRGNGVTAASAAVDVYRILFDPQGGLP